MTDKLGTPKSNEWRMPREIENELSTALRVNNPCRHNGSESFVCEVCGYPDPRKVLAALKRKYDALVAENSSLREALEKIANWNEGIMADMGIYCPEIIAREALEQKKE